MIKLPKYLAQDELARCFAAIRTPRDRALFALIYLLVEVLADGSLNSFLGTTLTVEWFGQPRRVPVDVVPAVGRLTRTSSSGAACSGTAVSRSTSPSGTVLVSRA